ncbi:MAG: glycosyltransferase family 4 protein, partial [Mesorhizobium sp.]
ISMGGAPNSLATLVAGLDKSEFTPIIVMPKREGNGEVKSLFGDAGALTIEVEAIRPFHGSAVARNNSWKGRAYALASYPLLVSAARQVVSKIKPDIVHLNSTCLVAAAAGAHMESRELPVIAHVREPLLQNWWGRMLALLNRRHVDYFVGIDQAGLSSLGGNINGSVVRNSYEETTSKHDHGYRYSLGFSDSDVLFLSLSRVSESNGPLELAQLISQSDGDLDARAKFVVAGFSPATSRYAEDARALLQANVRSVALEFLPDPGPILNAADVIIAPFVSPHSARSVFEGAVLGKPAIVTPHPNLLELVEREKTGLVFSLQDRMSFVSAVNTLCDLETRKRLGSAAQSRAKFLFDPRLNNDAMMEIYRHLIFTGRGQHAP